MTGRGGGHDGKGMCGIMSIRRNKAGCLMVLIKHVTSPPSVIPDVGNRESMVSSCWTLPSLTVRHHGAHHSAVIALPEGVCLTIEPWSKTVLTGFPLKTAGMTEGPAGMTERGLRE